jgi:hypothetical protein
MDKLIAKLKLMVESGKLKYKLDNQMDGEADARYLVGKHIIEYRSTSSSETMFHELIHAYNDLYSKQKLTVQDDESLAYMCEMLFKAGGSFSEFQQLEQPELSLEQAENIWKKIWDKNNPSSIHARLKSVTYSYKNNKGDRIDANPTDEQIKLLPKVLGLDFSDSGREAYRQAYISKYNKNLSQ